MSYASQADMVLRFGEAELIQLTDHAGIGALDAEVLAQALADAAAVIDGYLAGRYSVPLSTLPPILVGYACDMARARLYREAASELILQRAADAVRFLTLVGQGKISLGAAPPDAVSDNVVQVVSVDRRRFGIGL